MQKKSSVRVYEEVVSLTFIVIVNIFQWWFRSFFIYIYTSCIYSSSCNVFLREWPTPELWLPLSSPEFSITWAWMSTLKSWSFCWGNSRTQPVVTSTTQPLYKLWIKVRPNPGKQRAVHVMSSLVMAVNQCLW